ncbi:MAG: MFS transporter [Chloroflexi bacterium]|nr:MFS transporter [Chloroflexota bacterium]
MGPLVTPSIALAAFAAILTQSAFGPFLPVMAESLDTTIALLGQIPAVSMLLAALLGLAVGPLADRYGQRRALLVGLGAMAVSAFGTSLAPRYGLLFAAMMVGAVGRASVLPVTLTVAATRFVGDAQRRALSWTSTGTACAPILGIPILTTIGQYAGWRVAFGALVGIVVATMFLIGRGLPREAPARTGRLRFRTLTSPYGPLLRHHPTSLLIVSSLFGNIGLWHIYTYVGAFWVLEHGLSLQEVGWTSLVQGLGGLSGGWLMSGRIGRIAPRRLIVFGRVGGGLLMALPFVIPIPTAAAVACLAVAYVLGSFQTIATSLVLANESPAGRATTLTFNGAAWSVGIALGASLGGLALSLGGFKAVGVSAYTAFLVASLLTYISGHPRLQPAAPPVSSDAIRQE